jgi:hypothetical protein
VIDTFKKVESGPHEKNHLVEKNYLDSLPRHRGESHRLRSIKIENSQTEAKSARSTVIDDSGSCSD